METILYYIKLFVALCGFDGSEGGFVFGWLMVSIATVIVVYTFYQGIVKTLWPGEQDTKHIKYRILEDDTEDRAHAD